MIKLLLKNYWLLLGIIFCSSVAAILETANLAALAPLINAGSPTFNSHLPFPFKQCSVYMNGLSLMHKLQLIALIILVLTPIKNMFVCANTVCSNFLRSHVIKHYRMLCIKRVMHVGLGYIQRKRSADIQQLFDNHMDSGIGVIIDSIVSIQPLLFTLVLLVAYLFTLSVTLTVLSILLVTVSLIVLTIQAKKIRKAGEGFFHYKQLYMENFWDIWHGMKIVRLFGRENFMIKEYEKRVDEFNTAFSAVLSSTAMAAPMFEICGITILAAILLASSFIVDKDPGAYSMLLIFILIWLRIIPPVKAINTTRATVLSKLPALKEINAFVLETKEQSLANGTRAFQELQFKIEFKNVNFSYAQDSPQVLHNVSFVVSKGQRVGIVGISGSGKSTLGEILLRFYDPQNGQILIDGVDLREFDISSWRRAVGVVSQDTFLFHDTIFANIAFSNPQATKEMVVRAAQRAYAHDFIAAFPEGYQTRIGDRGVLLSGGQRQRIAIARAILNEPEILFFDEATSALDSESEKNVQNALDAISFDKTVITIAHRFSTVMNSDFILVMDQGGLVEQGIPSELIAKEGIYRKLAQLQSLGE